MTLRQNLRIPAILSSLILFLVIFVGSFSIIANPAMALLLDYNQAYLVGEDLSHRDLTEATFTRADLRNSNLSYANLQGVSLFSANLESANLEGADLSYSTISTARFFNANLKNAILEGSFAFNARFDGAIIEGADFTDVLFRPDTEEQLCAIASGTNPITGRDTRDTLFCP